MNNKELGSVSAGKQLPSLQQKQKCITFVPYVNFTTNVPQVNSFIKEKGEFLVPSDDGQRIIGQIKDGVFSKSKWHSTKHLCYKHNAIGIDKGAFETYILPNADIFRCHDRDKDVTYTVRVDDFQQHCIEDNLGWGVQLFCPLEYWQVKGNGHHQLSLWGGGQ